MSPKGKKLLEEFEKLSGEEKLEHFRSVINSGDLRPIKEFTERMMARLPKSIRTPK